jgi:DNA-directed RNA polymerase specialized sigma24 family protein
VPKAIEAVWKIESTRLIAGIARVTRDIGIAEELAQDALVAALELWPEEGIPENPGAWLMTAAKRRAIDALRRGRMLVSTGKRPWSRAFSRRASDPGIVALCRLPGTDRPTEVNAVLNKAHFEFKWPSLGPPERSRP